MRLQAHQKLTKAARLAGTAGLVVLLHGTAAAPQDAEQLPIAPDWVVPMGSDQSMGSALAPQATPLANRPVADRTPSPHLPEIARL